MILELFVSALVTTDCLPPLSQARIRIEPATVWIQAQSGTVVAFDRSKKSWRRARSFLDAAVDTPAYRPVPRGLLCFEHGDTLAVAPGVRLIALDSVTNGAAWTLHHDGSARAVPLKIADRFKPKPRMRTADEVDEDAESREATEFSPYPSVMLRDGDLVWFGLYGSDTDNGVYLGGLLRYSLRTRTLTSFPESALTAVGITSMAVAGGTLWLGTAARQRDEYRPEEQPGVGLVRFGRDGKFQVFTTLNSPLPDVTPGAIASAGDTLWIATDRGVALLDARAMKWDVRYFRQEYTLDSTYIALAQQDPESTTTQADSARQMIFILMEEMRVADRAGFLAAASRLDPQKLAWMLASYQGNQFGNFSGAYMRGIYYEAAELLRDPVMQPAMRQVLRTSDATFVPSLVFRENGDSSWHREMRAAMLVAPRPAAVSIAGILADSGDAEAITWVRAALRKPEFLADTARDEDGRSLAQNLLWIVEQHPDPANIRGLLTMLEATGHESALRALFAAGDVPSLVDAARVIEKHPSLDATWLSFARDWGKDSLLLTNAAIRVAGKGVVHRALVRIPQGPTPSLGETGYAAGPVARAAADLEDGSAVPLLLPLLKLSWMAADPANEALIRLTGAQPPARMSQPQEFSSFWNAWWTANGRTFRTLTRAQGDAAFARYQKSRQDALR